MSKFIIQVLIRYFMSILFVGLLLFLPMDFKYHWSAVPEWLLYVSVAVMIGGYIMFFIVMMQNSYAVMPLRL
jgi:hypothetical protein